MRGRRVGRIGRPGLIGTAARTAVVAGTATAVSGRMVERQAARAQDRADAGAQQLAQQPVPAEPPAPGGITDETVAQLQRLAELQKQGILTDEEFVAQKARVLGM
jgi:hypothetical protein